MDAKIRNIWLAWLGAMAVLVGVAWLLMMFPLPGGSAGTPTGEEFLGFFAHIGAWGTAKLLIGLVGPPIVLTYLQIWKRNRGY